MKEYLQSIPEAGKLFLSGVIELGKFAIDKVDTNQANKINTPEDES